MQKSLECQHFPPYIKLLYYAGFRMASDVVGEQKSGSGRVWESFLGFRSGWGTKKVQFSLQFLGFWVQNLPKIGIGFGLCFSGLGWVRGPIIFWISPPTPPPSRVSGPD